MESFNLYLKFNLGKGVNFDKKLQFLFYKTQIQCDEV